MDGSIPSRNPTSITDLANEITDLAGQMNAANYRWLTLLAEFDRRSGWHDGSKSCAHWLNWKIGITIGAAREKVRVAHALEKLPLISAAMASGELSYYKVREITRVACPATEKTLLMYAQHGSAFHVEKMVRLFRRAKEAAELSREAAQQQNRSMSYHWDDDGSLVIKARLPAETGALVVKALGLAIDEINQQEIDAGEVKENVPYGTSVPKSSLGMRRADALGMISESFLAHGAEEMIGGEKHQVVIHVSSETLSSAHADRTNTNATKPGCCEFEDGPSIAAETARRFACDASTVKIIEDDEGNPLNVGRKTRTISPALQRALKARDGGCRFPGCCNTRYVHAHHIIHWAHGGETKLSNLVLLCSFHHRFVHEGGVRIEVLNDGAFRFIKANGEAYENVAAKGAFDASRITIHGTWKPAQWTGGWCDYGMGVEVLLRKVGMHESMMQGGVPGETPIIVNI